MFYQNHRSFTWERVTHADQIERNSKLGCVILLEPDYVEVKPSNVLWGWPEYSKQFYTLHRYHEPAFLVYENNPLHGLEPVEDRDGRQSLSSPSNHLGEVASYAVYNKKTRALVDSFLAELSKSPNPETTESTLRRWGASLFKLVNLTPGLVDGHQMLIDVVTAFQNFNVQLNQHQQTLNRDLILNKITSLHLNAGNRNGRHNAKIVSTIVSLLKILDVKEHELTGRDRGDLLLVGFRYKDDLGLPNIAKNDHIREIKTLLEEANQFSSGKKRSGRFEIITPDASHFTVADNLGTFGLSSLMRETLTTLLDPSTTTAVFGETVTGLFRIFSKEIFKEMSGIDNGCPVFFDKLLSAYRNDEIQSGTLRIILHGWVAHYPVSELCKQDTKFNIVNKISELNPAVAIDSLLVLGSVNLASPDQLNKLGPLNLQKINVLGNVKLALRHHLTSKTFYHENTQSLLNQTLEATDTLEYLALYNILETLQ